MDPVTAVIQPDPYPYYAELVAHRPGYFDDGLNAVVLSSAELVEAALAAAELRVRPVAEPVPPGVVGTAREVFGQLVRMTDGPLQQRLKDVVTVALASLDADRVREQAVRGTDAMLDRAGTLDDIMFRLPARVLAELCGLTDGADAEAARLAGDFVLCLSPAATAEQQLSAAAAADRLCELMAEQQDEGSPNLLGELARAARRAGMAQAAGLLANAVGFFSQTYDATAALLGNTLLALGRRGVPGEDLAGFVREVARHDSPVHNTRRFAAAPVTLGDQRIEQGQLVLVLLAAANRDPAANPDPAEFRPDRGSARLFTFGAARHGCPGEQLAIGIAGAVVSRLLAAGFDPTTLDQAGYRPSGNIRCPLFSQQHQQIPAVVR